MGRGEAGSSRVQLAVGWGMMSTWATGTVVQPRPGQPQTDEKETDLGPGPVEGLDGARPLPALAAGRGCPRPALAAGWGLLAM